MTDNIPPVSGPATVSAASLDLPERMRVHALARLLGRSSREVLDALTGLGVLASSPQSGIDRKTAEQVVSVFHPEQAAPVGTGEPSPSAEPSEPAPSPRGRGRRSARRAAGAPSPIDSDQSTVSDATASDALALDATVSDALALDATALDGTGVEATDTEAGRARTSASTRTAAAPLAPLFAAPTFQAPERPARPVRGRRRANEEPAGPVDAVGSSSTADDRDQPDGSIADAARAAGRVSEPAVLGDTGPAADDSTDSTDNTADSAAADSTADDSDDDGRRRRRRGRRGRGRGRGADEDGADGAEEAERSTAADGDPAGDDTDDTDSTDADDRAPSVADDDTDTDTDDAESEDSDDAAEDGGSRRRRRRRRRRGSEDGEAETDASDPPHTVTKVRAPRQRDDDDGVQGVRGSTRLEAKRQRRRDGRDAGRRRTPILSESEFLARRESVERTMVVREHGDRVEVAVLEDDVLVEHFVAGGGRDGTAKSLVGNIYLGRVQNVLPSMEAAFVDIGRGRNAVLYAGEVDWDGAGLGGKQRRIEQALSSGDSVLVQVTKDPIGHKGARLTTQISLAGRFLVYVPSGGAAGISRKLPDVERRRLKDLLKEIVPSEAGVIIRTASEGVEQEALERDVRRLQAQWDVVRTRSEQTGPNKPKAPTLLYEEPDLLIKVVRDQFNEDFSSLVVEGADAWDTVQGYVSHVAPELADRMRRHVSSTDVFAAHRIDEQLLKALDRKVWLPSGGTLVIDRTEAMTVVDVNTGKFTGSGGNLEETVTRNNLEAAEEIVRQLRLRDIGGIIVVDFIDMVLEGNRDLVLRRLTECLARDRTRHQVAEVTSLGLVQMTRKRVGGGLLEHFSSPCEHCRGRGVVVDVEPVTDHGRRNGSAVHDNGRGDDGRGDDAHGDNGNGGGRENGRRSRRRGRGDDERGPRPELVEAAVDAVNASVASTATGADADTVLPDRAVAPAPSTVIVEATVLDDATDGAAVADAVADAVAPVLDAPVRDAAELVASGLVGTAGVTGGVEDEVEEMVVQRAAGRTRRRASRAGGRSAATSSAEPVPATEPGPAGSGGSTGRTESPTDPPPSVTDAGSPDPTPPVAVSGTHAVATHPTETHPTETHPVAADPTVVDPAPPARPRRRGRVTRAVGAPTGVSVEEGSLDDRVDAATVIPTPASDQAPPVDPSPSADPTTPVAVPAAVDSGEVAAPGAVAVERAAPARPRRRRAASRPAGPPVDVASAGGGDPV